MGVLILLYDQLFFRPIVAWADRYRFEQTASAEQPGSWAYDLFRRTRMLKVLMVPLLGVGRLLMMFDPMPGTKPPRRKMPRARSAMPRGRGSSRSYSSRRRGSSSIMSAAR